MPVDFGIPENQEIDLHDVATLIFDTYWRADYNLPRSQLVEILQPGGSLQSLPQQGAVNPLWHLHPSPSKVAYVLRFPRNSELEPALPIDEFLNPDGVIKPPSIGDLTRKDVEEIYWRCKLYNTGHLLTYVAQRVLRSLPASTTIVARTSTGYQTSFKCSPECIRVEERKIKPKKPCMILNFCLRPDINDTAFEGGADLSGFEQLIPWKYLVLGESASNTAGSDYGTRVILDLSIARLGGRGGGCELFAMEQGTYYSEQVLPVIGDQMDTGQPLSSVLLAGNMQEIGEWMVNTVVTKLRKIIVNGMDDHCRYCGKPDVGMRCSRCKNAKFCPECHILGWKYHKKWCVC